MSQNHEWTVKAEPIRLTLRTASNLLGRKQSYQGYAAYDGKQRAMAPSARRPGIIVDLPLLGSVLYRLNVNAPVVRMMARGHVYSDPNWLIGERFKQKMAVTRAPGARYASIRFVTGMLDLVSDRPSFIELAEHVKDRILVLYGTETPRRSKAELEALMVLPQVQAEGLPHGKLAVHEEFPEAVAKKLSAFLNEHGAQAGSG